METETYRNRQTKQEKTWGASSLIYRLCKFPQSPVLKSKTSPPFSQGISNLPLLPFLETAMAMSALQLQAIDVN